VSEISGSCGYWRFRGLEFLAGKISWGRMAGSGIPKALWF